MKKHMILLLVAIGLVSIVQAETVVVTYQQGSDSYAGTEDAFLMGNNAAWLTLNTGGSNKAKAMGVPWGGSKSPGLVQFNSIAIPEGAEIVSATLTLTAFEVSNTGSASLRAYPMLTDWVEGNSSAAEEEGATCFSYRRFRADGDYTGHTEDAWGTDGLIHTGPVKYDGSSPVPAGNDYWSVDPLLSQVALGDSVGSWSSDGTVFEPVEFDVTGMVSAWLDGELANNGVYLYGSGYWDGVSFYPSESTYASSRPKLEIEYQIEIIPENTVVYRQGLNDYTGTEDAFLMGNNAAWLTLNTGGSNKAKAMGVPWGGAISPGLLQFNSIAIPEGAEIVSATLTLTAFEVINTGGRSLRAYPMLTDWVEGTSSATEEEGATCFSYRCFRADGDYAGHPEDAWGTDGLIHTGPVKYDGSSPVPSSYDYWSVDPRLSQVALGDSIGSWGDDGTVFEPVEFDVTDMASDWLSGELANNGMYLYGSGYWDGISFYPSESPYTFSRPKLSIEYIPFTCGHPDVPYPDGDISGPDGQPDCYIDLYDIGVMAEDWVECTVPDGAGCVEIPDAHVIMQGSVTVDGDLGEWADADWIDLDEIYSGDPCDVSSAVFALKWNADANMVYAAVVVDDSEHNFEDFPTDWDSSDRVEIYSQADPDFTAIGWRTTHDKAQHYHTGKGTTPDYEWQIWAVDGMNTYIPESGFESEVVENGSEIIYEIGVRQFAHFGAPSSEPDIVRDLQIHDEIGFDLTVVTKKDSSGSGVLSENMMTGKWNNAGQFQRYTLVSSDGCGLWGWLPGDVNKDCKVDLHDFAEYANQWLYCTEPLDEDCDHSWQE